ncbi:MAG: EAL domain-containing protein [Acidimicrobiales bacterium]|nr:EAL domain-containing protein [Acidimicrobiales bacterium]
MTSADHDIPSPAPAPGHGRDGLAVADAVGRALAGAGLDDALEGYGRALRILAEGFDAYVTAIMRFEDDGAHVSALWGPTGLVRDPQLRVGEDLLPPGAPLRSRGESMLLTPDDFDNDFGTLMRQIGDGASMLVTPIFDEDIVSGAVAVLAPDLDDLDDSDRMAVQLCGEILWRHMRHHDAREELRQRADVAEILARVGGRLHEGGIGEARELLDEVLETVGRYVGATAMRTYEWAEGRLHFLLEWAESGEADPGHRDLSAAAVEHLGQGGIYRFDEFNTVPDVEDLVAGFNSGVVVPGIVEGELVGVFVVGRIDNRPLADTALELVTNAVAMLGQFRMRMGAELDLVRRGVVEQARTEIAESFLNATAATVDETAQAALERIGGVFGARRVRFAEIEPAVGQVSVVMEWSDGTRPQLPTEFDLPGDVQTWHEPFVLQPEDVLAAWGRVTTAATMIVPTAVGDDVRAVLTLTGDRVGAELPADELRTLTDLAGVILQARARAAEERQQEYRQVLDDLQLRLGARFLDRSVVDSADVITWALGELGEALDTDVISFAEYLGSSDGTVHSWSRDGESLEPTGPGLDKSVFQAHCQRVLDSGRPTETRSRQLPDGIRLPAEAVAGSEFSMLVVPFRSPGIALLLGVCSLRDREWTPVERALLQQVIGQIRQFIDVVSSRAQLEYDATHDALTGLANRRKLADEFTGQLATGGRGALLMIDVDRFKVVNDSLGHSAGDAVLVAIAERIRRSLRGSDVVARFGGDEFAVLVHGDSDMELAVTAQRLIEVIREPIIVHGTTVIPTCSVGIARSSGGDDVEAVLRHADAALYDAKTKGRDRYEFFDEAHRATLRDRLHLETDLRRGVAAGEFLPWFQPEYDLITNEIVGVEALVRWDHPTEGVIEAARFIDTAEEIGLAPELSRLVLGRSFETLQRWVADGFETRIRVNVAAAQLQSGELAEQISRALDAHEVPASLLCVEITERSLMLDADSAIDALQAVRDLGVEVAVDDFGTGFSSLARLKHLPVDTLKIDRSFVSGIVTSSTDREIVRTIIWLSRGLGLDVVAEGVEETAQAEMLLELGCRRAQGWLWSKAVPAEDVPRLARV